MEKERKRRHNVGNRSDDHSDIHHKVALLADNPSPALPSTNDNIQHRNIAIRAGTSSIVVVLGGGASSSSCGSYRVLRR